MKIKDKLKILYLVRSEADFERVIALGVSGKGRFEQYFIYTGDVSLFFNDGIKNKFLKDLFKRNSLSIKNYWEYDFFTRVCFEVLKPSSVSIVDTMKDKSIIFKYIRSYIFRYIVQRRKKKFVAGIFKSIGPNILVTDRSQTIKSYLPEIIRRKALEYNIPSFIFAHGAGGGLHSSFSPELESDKYTDYYVVVCNEHELLQNSNNHVVIGDISSSFNYITLIHKDETHSIEFGKDRDKRLVFFVSGGPSTATNGWCKMEEIIVNLSSCSEVSIIVKTHPRSPNELKSSIINSFSNVTIVDSEIDNSRLIKWANIIVATDQCSVVFEPMILGKKVVAIETVHIPRYKNKHSPLVESSVVHITSPSEFNLNDISNSDPNDPIINEIAWGGNGKIDLAKLFLDHIEKKLI